MDPHTYCKSSSEVLDTLQNLLRSKYARMDNFPNSDGIVPKNTFPSVVDNATWMTTLVILRK